MSFTELSTLATTLGCTLSRGEKRGFVLTMRDGSSKRLGTLQQVSQFLDRVQQVQELISIARKP